MAASSDAVASPTPPRFAGARTSAWYAAMFAALGVHLPFWPIWLADWGLTGEEVGLYMTLSFGARLAFGAAVPVLADRHGARRLALAAMCALGALAFLWHLGIASRTALLIGTLITTGVFAALVPIGDALGLAAARDGRFDYARVRAWGSAAFLGASLALGYGVEIWGADAALWTLVALLAVASVLGWTHPGGGRVAPGPRPSTRELARLALRPVFALVIAAAALSQASHATLYAYGSLHWRALGLSEGEIGNLWAWGVAVEIALMSLAGAWLTRRLGATGALALAGAAGALRWALMTADPTGLALWVLQASHALTFAASHLGAMAFLRAAVPERMSGGAQALFQTVAGTTLMLALTWASSQIYPQFGAGAYWLGAAASAGALVCALAARHLGADRLSA
ncbi:MAG: MFS transporter [Pseudomonadota bacterium]